MLCLHAVISQVQRGSWTLPCQQPSHTRQCRLTNCKLARIRRNVLPVRQVVLYRQCFLQQTRSRQHRSNVRRTAHTTAHTNPTSMRMQDGSKMSNTLHAQQAAHHNQHKLPTMPTSLPAQAQGCPVLHSSSARVRTHVSGRDRHTCALTHSDSLSPNKNRRHMHFPRSSDQRSTLHPRTPPRVTLSVSLASRSSSTNMRSAHWPTCQKQALGQQALQDQPQCHCLQFNSDLDVYRPDVPQVTLHSPTPVLKRLLQEQTGLHTNCPPLPLGTGLSCL